ncbi:MAG: 1,4-alpha-glucan branching enzyme, partial [Burkholderiales bacterium]|nr:1,4-alpha-glucan branching enzyme [Burkholderiales bacterium]
ENLEAVQFLKDFNMAVADHHPGCFTLAEESTAWPRVTGPVQEGGLGFTFKWNMGWMNDTLKYIEKDPIYRKYHQRNLTFGMLYQYSEEFMLPLSHDEVVHGKKSLLDKMPGDNWQKRANLRLLHGYMMGYPGKKLMFMGGEFGQWNEWWEARSLDWHLLDFPEHAGLKSWSADMNQLYLQERALWELDSRPGGFEWIQCDDAQSSVVSFLRFPYGHDKALAFVCNFTPVPRHEHRIGVPWGGTWKLRLNSDDLKYGGSGVCPAMEIQAEAREWDRKTFSLPLTVPPLAVVVLEGFPPPPPAQEESPAPAEGESGRVLLDEENR